MLFGQLDYISISFQLFNVLNIFFHFYLGLVVRRQKRNRLGSFYFIFGAWSLYACCAIIIIITSLHKKTSGSIFGLWLILHWGTKTLCTFAGTFSDMKVFL